MQLQQQRRDEHSSTVQPTPSVGQTTSKASVGVNRGSSAAGHIVGNWTPETMISTRFACRICGASMNHKRSLLRHQIDVHGRQKLPRGRPPTSRSFDDDQLVHEPIPLGMFCLLIMECCGPFLYAATLYDANLFRKDLLTSRRYRRRVEHSTELND